MKRKRLEVMDSRGETLAEESDHHLAFIISQSYYQLKQGIIYVYPQVFQDCQISD